jgi:hypothetical protein
MRPVALRLFFQPEYDESDELEGVEGEELEGSLGELPEVLWACAPTTRHAAQTAAIVSNFCLITCLSL